MFPQFRAPVEHETKVQRPRDQCLGRDSQNKQTSIAAPVARPQAADVDTAAVEAASNQTVASLVIEFILVSRPGVNTLE